MWLSELTLQAIGFRLLALLIIVGVQGAIVAGSAVLLGDRGPKYDGRLTAAPTAHFDPLGAVGLILFGLGWARPVDVDARQFGIGPAGILVVILAGFVGLLALAALLDGLTGPALTTLPHATALATAAFLRTASSLAIWFALLSLVPVPPLTAGLVLGALGVRLSPRAQLVLGGLLLAAVATGAVRRLLGPVYAALAPLILGG